LVSSHPVDRGKADQAQHIEEEEEEEEEDNDGGGGNRRYAGKSTRLSLKFVLNAAKLPLPRKDTTISCFSCDIPT